MTKLIKLQMILLVNSVNLLNVYMLFSLVDHILMTSFEPQLNFPGDHSSDSKKGYSFKNAVEK